MLHALEQDDIYISTQTACSTGNYSKAVYAVVRDEDRAAHSIRISLSYLTTKEEIDFFGVDQLGNNSYYLSGGAIHAKLIKEGFIEFEGRKAIIPAVRLGTLF